MTAIVPSNPVPLQSGTTLASNVLAQITAANGTAKPPVSAFHADTWEGTTYSLNSNVAMQSSSARVGPIRYARFATYAGWSSVTAFLTHGGGTSAEALWVVPPVRNCSNFAPVATAAAPAPLTSGTAQTNRNNLMSIYGAPELTGSVKHPTFTPPANVALVSKFLETCMADGACNIITTSTSTGYTSGTGTSYTSGTGTGYTSGTSTSYTSGTSTSYTSGTSTGSSSTTSTSVYTFSGAEQL